MVTLDQRGHGDSEWARPVAYSPTDYANDIATYETQSGLPSVTLANVLLDGFNGIPTTGPNSGNAEVALDIEMSISMAPGLSKVIVYEAGPNGTADDILSRMASDNQARQLSCSWSFGASGMCATSTTTSPRAILYAAVSEIAGWLSP